MGSRIRDKPDHLFEVFVEIASSSGDEKGPFILQKFPEDYGDKEALAMIPKFAYPCETDALKVDHFTFVLTDLEGKFRFGYCRHATGHQTCLCIVSCLPWCEVFFKLLDVLAPITNSNGVFDFLQATHDQEVPLPDIPVTIVAGENMFNFTSPDLNVLPSIPKSRNLTEYYNAVDPSNMMRIFASMVQERRIYMTSKKLSRLTACIHAAEALLYPMHWQHLYIPVLPSHLIDYISAPMPYLIGVHSNLVEKLKINRVDVGDAVIVDLDTNTVTTEYDDLESMPDDVQSYLAKSLKIDVVSNSMTKNGDAISVAFLQALVRLIGGYREALKIRPEEPITFDPEVFVRSRPSQSTQAYLEGMLALQIFQQFIYGRLEILNSGCGFTDIFEQQATAYTDKLNSPSKYKEWLKSFKKGGRRGKEVLSGLKVKVKVQGKKAIADMRTKISNITDNEDKRGSHSTFHVSGGLVHSKSSGRHQSPHSITEERRPRRPPRPPPPSGSCSENKNSELLKEDSQDDSQLRLSYHTVDVSLMADQDIQAAMMRSASAEVLPKNGREDWSGSTSTISSDSRSVDDTDSANIPFGSLHSSDDGSQSSLVDLPQVGYKSQSSHSSSGNASTTSEFATGDRLVLKPKPKQPASTSRAATTSSKPPVIPPRTPTNQSPSSSGTQSLRPPPRKPNASRQPIPQQQQSTPVASSTVTLQDAPLIKFESSESEATDSEVFDPLVLSSRSNPLSTTTTSGMTTATKKEANVDDLASIADVTMREKDGGNDLLENNNFNRSSSSRSSLSRSKAFRRENSKKMLRRESNMDGNEHDDVDNINLEHGHDDNDDVVTFSSNQDPTAAIFDPLTSSSSSAKPTDRKISLSMATPVSHSKPRRDSSADLMKHEWSLAFLSTSVDQSQQHHLPRQSTFPANPTHPSMGRAPRGPLLHQASMQQSIPYRSRTFTSSQKPGSSFQFIGGTPQSSPGGTSLGSISSSPQNTMIPSLSSNQSPSSSSFTSSTQISLSYTPGSHMTPSSSSSNQSKSVFANQTDQTLSSFNSCLKPATGTTGGMQNQNSKPLLNFSNSTSKQMTNSNASASQQGNNDPFGDLLILQFGSSNTNSNASANNKQSTDTVTRTQTHQQRREDSKNVNVNAASLPPRPPKPKWETFE